MPAPTNLTAELRAEVLVIEDDLRARVDDLKEVQAAWRAAYDEARVAERTSAAWEAWRDERVTLASVAWVITTVFVRFCEDNALVRPVWITHAGGRAREATDAQVAFLRETARAAGDVTDREWLLDAVGYLKELPATKDLVDDTSPMWLVMPSGDAASRLLAYWRDRDDNGALRRDLTDADLDTRFLGDLYQDVSEAARKRYALLQTPEFVEEFILDRTLEPALAERPLEGFKAIDPTCGSGHFLLGLFARLLDRWHAHAPGMDERERVQAALDSVYGVDLNPYAIAISRFRLTVAALRASGRTSLEDAPAFQYHLAVGDSLLHGLDQGELDLGAHLSADRVAAGHAYATENLADLQRILRNGQYDCVVGNPPYIQPPDRKLKAIYKEHYKSCTGLFVLSVPFVEKFFRLSRGSGFIGQITSNSFMMRRFGVKLVTEYLPGKDLTAIVDSEGVWMPGHNMDGTPTTILFGRNRAPASTTVRLVLGKGLRETPNEAGGHGPMWSVIKNSIDQVGFSNDWAEVVDVPRAATAVFPLSLSGGATAEIVQRMRRQSGRLGQFVDRIGYMAMSHADDAFNMPSAVPARLRLSGEFVRPLARGDDVRDYVISDSGEVTWFPYEAGALQVDSVPENWQRFFWPLYTSLVTRAKGRGTYESEGKSWLSWHQVPTDSNSQSTVLAYSEIASHNHFVLGQTGELFPQTAPILRFSRETSFNRICSLLAYLNSAPVCLWLRDQSKPKGGKAGKAWARTYQFASTGMLQIPTVDKSFYSHGARLADLSRRLYALVRAADELLDSSGRTGREYESIVFTMCSLQEEVDWDVYYELGLMESRLVAQESLPMVPPGCRAFEINLRRSGEDASLADWFGRDLYRSADDSWPSWYAELVERRIDEINSNPMIAQLEQASYKRPWAIDGWDRVRERSLGRMLLQHLDDRSFWVDPMGRPVTHSLSRLSELVEARPICMEVVERLRRQPGEPTIEVLRKVILAQAVPYLSALVHTESGIRKRESWVRTWNLQRTSRSSGDVPTEFKESDFQAPAYWRRRGKFNFGTEQFIVYPGAGRDTDPTPVLGWAGWDHAERALAVAGLIQDREGDGWTDDRLVPLVAGLAELLPWLKQWHSEQLDSYGGDSPAAFFTEELDMRMTQVGATDESLRAWRPERAGRGKKAKS